MKVLSASFFSVRRFFANTKYVRSGSFYSTPNYSLSLFLYFSELNVSTPFFNLSSDIPQCDPLTDQEVWLYKTVSWWFECLLQSCVGSVGFLANALAIPILCSKEMNSIFNKLLVFLAVFDNFYIICSVLEGIRYEGHYQLQILLREIYVCVDIFFLNLMVLFMYT
jgi:hypothetical protein